MQYHSFSYISVLIMHIHVRYQPPTRFIMGSDPWVNLHASTWSPPRSHVLGLLVFQVLFIHSHTLHTHYTIFFICISLYAWHLVITGLLSSGNKYFLERKENAYNHIYSVIAPSSVQSSAFKREDERKVKGLYGQSLSNGSESSQRNSGTCCATENFHR